MEAPVDSVLVSRKAEDSLGLYHGGDFAAKLPGDSCNARDELGVVLTENPLGVVGLIFGAHADVTALNY